MIVSDEKYSTYIFFSGTLKTESNNVDRISFLCSTEGYVDQNHELAFNEKLYSQSDPTPLESRATILINSKNYPTNRDS